MMMFMVLFWGALIWLLIVVVRRLGGSPSSDRTDPYEIARRRLASGELSEQEYDRILMKLRGQG